ncbi:acyl-CoA thioesterase [Cupriavidus basilensis]|uniref:acyl-CoA thioesterase n=1 Tax=Cupriavidus basilensis TaxID=68895 RepID=UPI003D33A363
MQWTSVLGTATEVPELMPVVANVGCTFHVPIGYPATLRVSVHCTRIGRSSFDLCFEIRDASHPDIHFVTATAVWVWVDKQSGRSAPAPASVRERCIEALAGRETRSEP